MLCLQKNLFHLHYGDLSPLLEKAFKGLCNYPVIFVADVLRGGFCPSACLLMMGKHDLTQSGMQSWTG